MILAPYVPTGARQLTNGGENEVRNDKFMEHLKISEIIQDDPIWGQEGSESFTDHQSSTKKVPIWRLGDVQKTFPRSHMNPQNHPKIHKSLVLAHNIHKDCPLGVVGGFSQDIWCEALSSIICSEGPERENQNYVPKIIQNVFCWFGRQLAPPAPRIILTSL